MKIWFDMDGTIADLYGVTDWLPALIADAFGDVIVKKTVVVKK